MSVVISNSVEWFSCLEKIGVNQPGEGVSVPVIAERKDVSHILVLKETDPGIVPAIPPILFTRFAIISSPDMKGTDLVCLYAKALWKTVAAEYGLRRMLKKRRRFTTALIYYCKYIYMQNLDLLVAIGNIMLTQKKGSYQSF
jgi:hypothetical protein